MTDTDGDTETSAWAQARVGSVLCGKWRLDRLIGIGGMAAVFAATHRNSNRVAIKVLHPTLGVHGQVKTRFLREGYVANKVEHPGTVRVLDDDADESGLAFLVMELLEGESFEARRLRYGGTLPAADVLSMMDQVLDVLAAAHAKGIVHRDIKPENLFVTNAGAVKILDFGIAHLRELSAVSTQATRAGMQMGTPAYMPPEQARGRWEIVDGQSDVWALGATMFHLLTGQLVHEAETANEMLLSAMMKPAASLATILVDAPPHLVQLVDGALAFEKANRWRDAQTMQAALRVAFHALAGVGFNAQPAAVPSMSFSAASAPLATAQPPTGVADPREVYGNLPATQTHVATGITQVPMGVPQRGLSKIAAAVGAALVLLGIAVFTLRPSPERADAAAGTQGPASVPLAVAAPSQTGVDVRPAPNADVDAGIAAVSDSGAPSTPATSQPKVPRKPPPANATPAKRPDSTRRYD